MKQVIIGIHGIGNKPSKEILAGWWKESMHEGLRRNNFPVRHFSFEMVYWADLLHKTPLDPAVTDRNNSSFMVERYTPEAHSVIKHAGFRQKAIEYLEKYYDKLIVNGVLSLENKTITEWFIHLHMKDLESYYSPTYIKIDGKKILVREAIIERLVKVLEKHKGKRILLLAHSMGSIIAHDTLIEKIPGIKIDTLVTIDSPLGQRYVLDSYKKELEEKSINKFVTPENVQKAWFNLSDLEDQVAINNKLANYYKSNSQGITVKDTIIKNTYTYDGISNPHKSFGYLRTREVAEIISAFISSEEKRLINWIKRIFSRN